MVLASTTPALFAQIAGELKKYLDLAVSLYRPCRQPVNTSHYPIWMHPAPQCPIKPIYGVCPLRLQPGRNLKKVWLITFSFHCGMFFAKNSHSQATAMEIILTEV